MLRDTLERAHRGPTGYAYWSSFVAMVRKGVDADDAEAVQRYVEQVKPATASRIRGALRWWLGVPLPDHWLWVSRRKPRHQAAAPVLRVKGETLGNDLHDFTIATMAAGASKAASLQVSGDVRALINRSKRMGFPIEHATAGLSATYATRLQAAWRRYTRWRASRGYLTPELNLGAGYEFAPTTDPTVARTQTPPAVAQERPGKASEGGSPGLHTSEASRALLGHLTGRLGWPLARCVGLRWSDCVITTDRTGEIRTLSAPWTGTPADWSSSGTLARKLTPLSDGHWRHVLWAHRAWTAPPHEDAPLFPRSPRSTEPLTEEQARLVLEGSIPLDPWGVDDFLAELAGGPEGADAPARAPKALPDYDDPIGMRPRMDDGRAHEITGAMFLAALDDLVEATREK